MIISILKNKLKFKKCIDFIHMKNSVNQNGSFIEKINLWLLESEGQGEINWETEIGINTLLHIK